ncbi:putative phage tail sheath protein [Streptomyces sp. NBRC 110611]|uniref:phage tail sheath family protein n=1 Tax=Streptomyces sp. NBRC 110611 TaxID=1621259 RepID=UPI0008331588|nr:phage tail sheath subtilisin-like domain-containing protein [Streptomyces sp. NBRC 110611]GAU70317.1 putative phage tail sheath protein [Streptomyces sp. NBRC 110611]
MPNYLSPGVFVEEMEGGSRPVEGVGTAVAAFVGFAEKGPLDRPVRVTNWSQFAQTFGDFMEGSYLGHSVYGYFANGGGTCYVVRVAGDSAAAEGQATVGAGAGAGAGDVEMVAASRMLGGFRITALPSAAGQDISVDVRCTEPEGGTGTRTRRSAAESARSRTGKDGGEAAAANSDKDSDKEGDKGADKGGDKDGVKGGQGSYRLTVHLGGSPTETFDVSTDRASAQYVVTQVRERSKLILIEEAGATAGAALALPEKTSLMLPAASAAESGAQLAGAGAVGVTGSAVGRYVGDVSRRSGLSGLEAIDDVTMVAAPDLMAAYERGALDGEQVKAVQMAMINHCEGMANRMAIIDPLPDMGPSEVYEWRQNDAGFDSKFAALYYPWIKVADPSTGKSFLMPPSGHVAGLWARNDEARGVHKAPANEVLRGALDLGIQITKGEQEQLNPAGVNCIRSFPGRGIRIWGARTLSSDPAWRYLNVRRLFNYLEESIFQGSQWVVFEPNDERLWATMRRNVAAFLVGEWRQGALFGATPDEAFYVKCDSETNPPEVIESGQVVCEIGVAPVKPAEFVVFRISQESLGGSGT